VCLLPEESQPDLEQLRRKTVQPDIRRFTSGLEKFRLVLLVPLCRMVSLLVLATVADHNTVLSPVRVVNMQIACRVTELLRGPWQRRALASIDQQLRPDFGLARDGAIAESWQRQLTRQRANRARGALFGRSSRGTTAQDDYIFIM
jgi:hypothetical protein